MPVRRLNPVVTLLITALCLTAGFGLGLQEEHKAALLPPEPPPAESVIPDPEDSTPVAKAVVPNVIWDYYLNGLILRTNDAFQASTMQLEDQENGISYRLSLQYGVGEEAAQISLERTEGENARYLRADSEDFLWGMGENGGTYRYNLRTVQLSHSQTVHTEISCLLDSEAPSYGSGALTELKDLQVEKEDNWSWKCFYETADGKRKKLRISKGYPDF